MHKMITEDVGKEVLTQLRDTEEQEGVRIPLAGRNRRQEPGFRL